MRRWRTCVSALPVVAALTGCHQVSAPSVSDPPVVLAGGSLPYTLTVSPNEACLGGYTGTLNTPIVTPIYPSEMALEGLLVVTGEHLSFAVPQDISDSPSRTGLTMDITRSGDLVSGTIGGGFSTMARSRSEVLMWHPARRQTNRSFDLRRENNSAVRQSGDSLSASSLRPQGPIRRGLTFWRKCNGLSSILTPGIMGPCVRRDDVDGLLRRFVAPQAAVIVRLDRTIQYAAASRFVLRRLWNTGSSAFADDAG